MVSHHQEKFSSVRPPSPSWSLKTMSVSSSVARQLVAAAAALRSSGGTLQTPLETSTTRARLQTGLDLENEEKDAVMHGTEQQRRSRTTTGTAHDTMASARGSKRSRKRANYLSHEQRCNIINRVAQGEQQAALAREYDVTRAAVCHMQKHRLEILSRPVMADRNSERGADDEDEDFWGPPGVELMVHELRATSALLRDERSQPSVFRRTASRLIMILVEEALVLLGSRPTEVTTAGGHVYTGLERMHRFCGITLSAGGYPFSVLLHQIEVGAPQGAIRVDVARDPQGQLRWRLKHLDLPANIKECKVLLFSESCGSGASECKAIEVLCGIGVRQRDISLVVIVCTSDGIVLITSHFPQVKIITAAVDAAVDPRTQAIVPGIGDFVTRYNGKQMH